jgi:hypothetical protein
MKLKTVLPLVVFATLAVPMTAQAQGTVRGAEEGAAVGDRDAGPLGAVVGGTVGGSAEKTCDRRGGAPGSAN